MGLSTQATKSIPSRLGSHRIHFTREKRLELQNNCGGRETPFECGCMDEGDSPLDNWIVDAFGSIPARIPRYRTSEWEMREIGFLCETCVEEGLRQSLRARCKFDFRQDIFQKIMEEY